jgi:hypothetical protein
MGWLEGLVTGYADRHGEIRRENAIRAEQAANREGDVYKALLNSDDPTIRGYAATGLLQSGQARKPKRGLAGWMGEMESSPIYPTLMKYISTPQYTAGTEHVTPGLPSKQTQGFLPTVPGQTPSLAQPTTSPTEGEPMATPQPIPQPAPEAAAPPQPPPVPPVSFFKPDTGFPLQPPPVWDATTTMPPLPSIDDRMAATPTAGGVGNVDLGMAAAPPGVGTVDPPGCDATPPPARRR